MVAKFMKTNFEEKHVPLKYSHMAGSNFGQRGHLSGPFKWDIGERRKYKSAATW